jgi:hypothetical protein
VREHHAAEVAERAQREAEQRLQYAPAQVKRGRTLVVAVAQMGFGGACSIVPNSYLGARCRPCPCSAPPPLSTVGLFCHPSGRVGPFRWPAHAQQSSQGLGVTQMPPERLLSAPVPIQREPSSFEDVDADGDGVPAAPTPSLAVVLVWLVLCQQLIEKLLCTYISRQVSLHSSTCIILLDF